MITTDDSNHNIKRKTQIMYAARCVKSKINVFKVYDNNLFALGNSFDVASNIQ